MESIIIWHARDGVWSCEGVMSPTPFMKAACTGFPILHHLHFAALEWIIVILLYNLVIPLCRLVIVV